MQAKSILYTIMLNHTKPIVDKPPVGTIVSVLLEVTKTPSVCIHHEAKQLMCTIIPLENKPNLESDGPWMLSCWGNGPGIVCFLQDWHGEEFRSVKIVEVWPKSVVGVPVKG